MHACEFFLLIYKFRITLHVSSVAAVPCLPRGVPSIQLTQGDHCAVPGGRGGEKEKRDDAKKNTAVSGRHRRRRRAPWLRAGRADRW